MTKYWNQDMCRVVLPLCFMLSVVGCTTVMIFVSPESRILAVDEDRTIGCLDTNSTPDAHVNWSTTATSANISTQMDFVTLIFRISELVLTEVDSGYCGQYTCTFTDSLSSATASITVEPVFEQSLMGHMVLIETPDLEITLTCTVYGGPGNAVNIVWSGPRVLSQPGIVEVNDGSFTSNLTLTNVTMFFSGVYECTARYNNSLCTSSISSNLRLDVIAPPSIIEHTQSPNIVNSGVNVGLSFRFLAHPSFTNVSCSGPNGVIMVNTPGFSFSRTNSDSNYQITLSTTVRNVNYIVGGNYLCTANNSAGIITATVLLIVRPVVEPQHVLARNGDNVSFMCFVQSFPEPFYIWEKNVDSTDGDSIPDMFSSSFGSGENRETGPLLTFEPVQYGNTGSYQCVVTFNATLEVSSNGVLLAVSPEGSVAVEAVNMMVLLDPNEEATLNCSASGGPSNTFMWFFEGQPIEGATTDILNLNQVEGGKYICQVSNVAGRENASIILTEAPHDVNVLSNLNFDIAPLGDNVTLQCINKGGPNNTYAWMKDSIVLDGEIRDTLNLTSIVPSSSGFYNCTVNNAAGYDSYSIALFVSPQGSVEASPTIIYGNHSDNAIFSCFAMGGPDNVFSWTHVRSNTVITNNSELALVDLMASDGGQYECLVENRAGRDNINVTLNVSPVVTEHPRDVNVTIIEGAIVLTCTATGFPSPTITWFHNNTLNVIGSYATESANVYTTKSIFTRLSPMTNDSGRYFCSAAIDGYDDVHSDIVMVLVQDVPESPESIAALEIQSRSIGLSWIEPHDNNAPIQGYFVFYEQPNFAGGERIIKSTSDEVITLNELFPGATYSFTVIAYNDIGNSTESEALHIRILEEAPMGSPLNITATSLSSTTVHVTWEEVAPIDRNGIITTYEVLYEPLQTFEVLMSIAVNTTNLSVLLVELHPFVIYNISLRAYTSMGNGPYSESIAERTLEDRPGVPVNVSVLANSSSDIIVYWEEVPAISRNGIILFYEVLFCSTLSSKTQSLNTTDAITFTLVLNHLEEFTEYNITVRAYTQIGAGESAPSLVIRTLVNEPEILAVFPSNVISTRGENITFVCFAVGSRFIDFYLWKKNGRIVGNNETLKVIVDASSGGSYTCTVSNSAGTDSSSTILYVEPFINVPLNDQTLTINGSNVNINCDAAGFPLPNVSWVDTAGVEVSNTSQLQFTPVIFGDQGNYRCELTTKINETNFSDGDETTLIVSPEGSVIVSPSGIVSNPGVTVTLVCTAMGGPNNTFQWVKDRTIVRNDSILNLVNIDASHGGIYYCFVSNAAGAGSASTTLYISPYIATPLEKEILATVDGPSVNISCDATGFPTPNVNWMNMLNIIVSNTSQLLFNPVVFGDEGLYRCTASAEINGTTLTALDETTLIISPAGSVSPLNMVARLDGASTLMCSALGGPRNLFLWEINGNIVGNDSILNLENIDASYGGTYTCIISNAAGNDSVSATLYVAPYIDNPIAEQTLAVNGSSVNIICSAAGFPIPNVKWEDLFGFVVSNTSQLNLNPVMFGDEGAYRCVATFEIGEAFTTTTETTLIVSPEGSGAISPLDVVACLNDDVTLICTAMGGPNTTFQWKMNGTIVGNDSTLTLAAIDASYGGNYTCTMSNAAGTDSASTTIYIAPYIVTPLEKQTLAFNGTDVIIFCNAAGFPTPTVSWVNAMGLEVSSTSLLQSNPTIFGLEGVYRCVAKTEINRSTFNITDETIFIVSPEGSVQVSPRDISLTQGDTLTFVCTAMGGPNNSFIWTKDGKIVGNETMLNVIDINASHGGSYRCTVSNAAGNDSASTTLYVAPYIVTQLEAETLAVNGSNLNISCNAAGFPAPLVVWVDMQGIEVSNSSELHFRPIQFGDEGLYRCVATTMIGELNFTAVNETTIVVSPEGSVVITPLDIVATLGDNVTFACSAMGSPNSTFQWKKNGTTVGNSSILNLLVIDVSYGGDYSCIVSNTAGTDIVSTTLYVAPYIVAPTEKQTLTENGSYVNINCDALGFPTPNVKWINMQTFEVSITSQLQFSPAMFGDEGVYICVAIANIDGTDYNATDETTVIVSPKESVSVTSPVVSNFGDNVTLICIAMGGPGNTFRWEVNGTTVVNDKTLMFVATDATYGGSYTCTVYNAAGNDSASTTLYVAPYIDIPLEKDISVTNGSNLSINCGATGFPTPTVKWLNMLDLTVSNTLLLEFGSVMFGDEGLYHCIASTEINGTNYITMDQTTINVSPAGSVVVSPQNVVLDLGNYVTLLCTAKGGPDNFFQWERNGTVIGNNSNVTLVAVDASHGGDYTCTVSNTAGTESASTMLYVAPYIITSFDKQILIVNGSNLNITCIAAGFPSPTVKWVDMLDCEVSGIPQLQFSPVLFGDEGVYYCIAFTEISGMNFTTRNETTVIVSPEGGVLVNPTMINGSHGGNATFNCFALGGPHNVFSWTNLRSSSVVGNDSQFTIFNIMASDGGQYQCSVENPAGEDSINVTLNVSPVVTEHPQAQNVTNVEGTIRLSCTVTGFPLPVITWFHNNTLEGNNLSSTEIINVYTSRSTFTKSIAVLNDSGMYFCKAFVDGYDDLDSNAIIVLVQDTPEQPQNLTVQEIMSRSLILQWTEPHDNSAPIQGYFVLFKQPSFAGGETVIHRVSNETVSVSKLIPGVKYNLTVIAYNKIGNSTESENITVRTLEEAPSGPPQSVKVMSLSSTSILVSWAELPIINRNGLIILYEILYEPCNTSDQFASYIRNTTGLSVILMGLRPFVTYAISVRAYTIAGHGPYSAVHLNRTQEDAPSAPTNVTAIEITSTYVIITWTTPEFPNGIIRGYTVLLTGSSGVLVSNISTTDMVVNITDLSPFVQYSVVVFAETVEVGERSANLSLLTAEAAPSAPRNVTVIDIASTYVIISWRVPNFPNGNIRNYTVSLTERGGQFQQIIVTSETLVNITNLSPFVHYWAVIFAETNEIGEKSANITFRTSEESTFVSIDVQPVIPIEFGQNATITCVDTGAMTPVNWSTTALSAKLSNQQELFTLDSERYSQLYLTNVDSGYCGNYTCILPNSDMTGSVYLDIAPRFEESLMDHLVYNQSPNLVISLTCSVNGGTGNNIMDIEWSGPAVEQQPATIQTDLGIFTSNLILTRATMFFSGVYQCTAGYDNSLCTANVSSNARLDVIARPSIVDQTQSPHIVDKGVNVSLLFDFSAHPSFTSTSCSGPDGDIKMNTSSITLTRVDNHTTFQVILVINISIVNYAHGGIYTCVANNSAGDIRAMVLLIVRPIVEPELTLARMGDNITLMCLAQSFPEPSYLWEMISMTDSGGSGSVLDVSNAFESGSSENQIVTQPTLEFNPIEYGDNGNYRCVITFNGVWQVSSNEALLSVSPEDSVEIVYERVLFTPNEAVTLNCRASGGPNNTFLWFFNGEIVNDAATTDILKRSQVEGGEYTCQVSNIAGRDNASVVLIEAPHDVVVSSDVQLNVATIDKDVTLFCNNNGGPNNAYEWRKDGIVLNNEIDETLTLYSINVTSGGDYTCKVSNAAGVDFTTTMLYVAPFIVTPLEEETRAFNGSYVNVSCEVDGFPPPFVNWINMTSMEVSNTTLLEFSPVLVGDEGIYRCVATLEVNGTSIEATDETNLIVSSPTCRPEEISTNITTVTFKWPETNSGSLAIFICPNNMMFNVSRYCIPGGHWDTFNEEGCGTLAPILDMLVAQNLTNETLVETVEELSTLVQETETRAVEQNTGNLESIANVLVNVATFVNDSDIEINGTVVEDVVAVLNSLTQWTPTAVMANISSQIVMSFETVTTTYTRQIPVNTSVTFKTPFVTVTAENTAAMVLQITGRNLSFNNDASTSDGPVSPGELSSDQDAAISLPASLFERVNDEENVGVFFAIYETSTLFPVGRDNAVSDGNTIRQTQVGSQIVAATVDSSQELVDLENPVTVVFRLQFNTSSEFLAPSSEMCVSWDFSLQDWITRGCDTGVGQNHIITCTCNHLTNFAVLVDICERQEDCQPSRIEFLLTYVTYIGIPISIVCLVATLLTLTMFKKLCQKDISKYHIQLSLSLLFMLIVALVLVVLSAENTTPYYGGCLTISIFVHYFALVSVMFMAAEALLMFRKLATPFVKITSKYNIITSAVCWCVPILPVLITLIVDLAGGSDPANDIVIRREEEPTLCFLSHVGAFWGAFLGPVLVIMLFNTVLFVFISVVLIRHVRRKSRKVESAKHKVIIRTSLSIFGLMCLFGLTWLFAVLTFSASGLREAFQVLFTVFNSLQGAFIFIFTCVLSSEAREGWKSVFAYKSKPDHAKLSHYSSYKPGSTSTGTSTLQSGLFSTLLRSKKKKRRKENSLLIRTISVSATIPEDDDDDDVFEESDPEIEYELQVKPKSQQTDKVPSMAASGMAMHMEVVAVPKKETEFNMMSLLGEDIESSVTMFVNDGFIDVTESEMVMEESDTQSEKNVTTEKPNADNEFMRTPSTSTITTDSEVDGYTFYETDSEKEFQLQVNPIAQMANNRSVDHAVEVIAVTKRPTVGEEVESSVAVYINTAQSRQPLPPSGKRIWKLSSN